MPLTKEGIEIEHKFEKEYGKRRGRHIFYAWEHEHPFVMKHSHTNKHEMEVKMLYGHHHKRGQGYGFIKESKGGVIKNIRRKGTMFKVRRR